MRSLEEIDSIMLGGSPAIHKGPRSLEEIDKIMSSQKASEPAKEHTLGERILQPVYGFAESSGELIPSAMEAYGALAKQARERVSPEGTAEQLQRETAIPEAAEALRQRGLGKRFESLTGLNLEPSKEDTLGQVLTEGGRFLAPPYIPGTSIAKTAAGKIAGHVIPAFTAATAVKATPKVFEEGSTAGTVEDISKAILGGMAGGKAIHKLTGPKADIAQDIERLASQGRFKPRASIAAKVLAAGSKEPEARGFELAKKYDVTVPYNIGMGSRVQNYMANNLFKSIFTTQAYKDTTKKASEDMINAVRRSISHLGDSKLKPQEASTEYRTFLDSEYKNFKKESGELYENASKALNPTDSVIPSHTAKSIDSPNIRSLLESDIKSDATRKVTKVIGDLADAWGIKPKGVDLSDYENLGPAALSQIADAMGKIKKPISIKRLESVRSELMKMVDYDPSVRGVQANLSRLASDITKDIESSANKEYINRWNVARKHYSDNMRNRFETDIARSIMTGEAPVEAFNKMTNVQNIDILDKALGSSAKGREIFKDLSAAKVRQILEPVLEESLEKGTSLRTGAMTKMFSKGEAKQEVLERLIGKDSYDNLSEISEISGMFSKAGKDVLNTSGTAIAASDMDKITGLASGAIHVIFGAGLPAAAGTAATYAGSVNLLSRLASNKKFINEARDYAVARAAGKETQAKSILKRLIDTAKKEQQSVKFAGTELISKSQKEKENE